MLQNIKQDSEVLAYSSGVDTKMDGFCVNRKVGMIPINIFKMNFNFNCYVKFGRAFVMLKFDFLNDPIRMINFTDSNYR